ncbi:MAG TPA: hypothetical protein VFX77_11490 [Rubrobacter sp.]|nr:hypothetical protein [Rubrobacter sp.]
MGKEQYSYRITKNGKLFVYWHGEQGKREIVLKDPRAERLIRDLPAMDPEQQQLALARATANFKRGNERPVR